MCGTIMSAIGYMTKKWFPALYYKATITNYIRETDTNARHHRTQRTHPGQDTKVPGTDTPLGRQPSKLEMNQEELLGATEEG